MICPYCTVDDTRVVETRIAGTDLRRRRECGSCKQRFTTYERVERQELRVVKKDGKRETFDRDKVKKGILVACEKRPVSEEEIEAGVAAVEDALYKTGELEVSSSLVGELTMKELRKLDEVAYVRFASVYKQFTDVDGFMKEIKKMTKG